MSLRLTPCAGLLLLLVLCGCDVSDPSKVPARNSVVTPPGVAPVGFDLQDAGRAAPAQPAPTQPTPAQPAPGQQVVQPGQPMPVPMPMAVPMPMPANPAGNQSIIGQSTNQVVEMRMAMMQNPNLKIVDNRAQGDDPLSFACSAYVSVRSQASMLGFKSALNQHRQVEGRNLTYAEFIDMMKQHRVEFTALYRWQMYAYDPQEGKLVILEDPTLKK